MKLTLPQRYILDKMLRGWRLRSAGRAAHLQSVLLRIPVSIRTVDSLVDRDLITADGFDGDAVVYRLTDDGELHAKETPCPS